MKNCGFITPTKTSSKDESDDSSDKQISTKMNEVSRQSVDNSPSQKVRFAPDPATLLMDRVYLPRLVEKTGTCNVESRTITGKHQIFMSDFFTTLLDTPWRVLIPIFALTIVVSWLIFAIIFYVIAKIHGDFKTIKDGEDWIYCVSNGGDFISLLLFSMETQTTIGYGSRYVTDECPGTIVFVIVQSILGALIEALLTGMVIAKIQKPKKRSNTILFSRNVCVYHENGKDYLAIRLGDLQRSDTIETCARAVYVTDRITKDGDFISHFRYDLELDSGGSTRISLRWPVVVRHHITSNSPFWNMDQDEVRRSHFELVVFMQGVMETTGMTVVARTSYLPGDFLWDRKFKSMGTRWAKSSGTFDFDYSQFHETIPSQTTSPCINRRASIYMGMTRRWSQSDSYNGVESGIGECGDSESTSGSEYSSSGYEKSRKISNTSHDITSLSEDNSG